MHPLIAHSWGWLLTLPWPWCAIELQRTFSQDLPCPLASVSPETPSHLSMWSVNQSPSVLSFTAQNIWCREQNAEGRTEPQGWSVRNTVWQDRQGKCWEHRGPCPAEWYVWSFGQKTEHGMGVNSDLDSDSKYWRTQSEKRKTSI